MAPASTVFALVDTAIKNADVGLALQVVERQYGTLELHGRDPADVRSAAGLILERPRLTRDDRARPERVADETISRVSAARRSSSTGCAPRICCSRTRRCSCSS